MKQITEEVTAAAREALEKDDWGAFFEAFGFKVYAELEDAEQIELESHTPAGGDMIATIDVTEDWKEAYREYVENFDSNEEVALWWHNGQKGRGVPFDNMKEHYDDLEDWLDWQKDIIRIMDGGEPEKKEEPDPAIDGIEAVRKWVYWCYNYEEPAKFVKAIWGDSHLADHILEKFYSYKNDMNRLYVELDRENRTKLVDYVLKNYNP